MSSSEENDQNEEEGTISRHMNDVEWSTDHENILVEWADKAMCYRWLHGRANSSFSKKNAWYTIPVIVISTLTGTANFAQDRVPAEYQNFFVMGVGGFNILAGIITTIQQFLKITQLNEAHRVASIAWDKFYRNIKTELSKHPKERIPVIQFLIFNKEEIDRLMETSPVIQDDIIEEFRKKFQIAESFTDIIKPEICDSLISTKYSRNPWYTEENQTKLRNKELKESIEKAEEAKRNHENQVNQIKDFKSTFFDLNNREALDDEIVNNMKEKIDPEIIKGILVELINANEDTLENFVVKTGIEEV